MGPAMSYKAPPIRYDQRLLEQHAVLVKRIAHHLMARLPSSVAVDDLIQAGMIGLMEALQKYDAARGASFDTYAGIRIRGAMLDEVRRSDWAPRSVHRQGREVGETIRRLEHRLGRAPAEREIAAAMELSLEEYHQILHDSVASRLFSFDALIEEGGQPVQEEKDLVVDEVTQAAMRQALAEAISQLPEREALVLSLYYDEELNLKEIGEVLGVSESRVSQIHSQAVARLRARLSGWRPA